MTESKNHHSPRAEKLPRLNDLQLGHLRHIRNLVDQADGDWSYMGSKFPLQEVFDSYRYQLAHFAYTLALAHYHHLPAAPGLFKHTFERIIDKMLHQEVWDYWSNASKGSTIINPALPELGEGWRDPIVKENIMYSGHLHAMVGMYGVLFDDDRYERPGALRFEHLPLFWGKGPEVFEYNFSDLNKIIYWQMVENGWLGVQCEPNCIFLVCNQFPMLGFRFHDHRFGEQIAEEATASYRAAWEDRGWLTENDGLIWFLRQQQDMIIPVSTGVTHEAWTCAVMNAWNRDFVHEHSKKQLPYWFEPKADGTVALNDTGTVIMQQMKEGLGNPLATLMSDTGEYQEPPFTQPDFGFAAIWLSELGETALLDGLLKHADSYMSPSWVKGGLYYPRHDEMQDEAGNITLVDPLTGNALLAYARLNVKDGLNKLYQHPWTKTHFQQPQLVGDNLDLLNVLQACYDEPSRTLLLTLKSATSAAVNICLRITNLSPSKGAKVLRDGRDISKDCGWDDNALLIHCSIKESTRFDILNIS